MEPLNECPSDGLLTQFLAGRLEPEAVDHIAIHLEDCSDCQTRLEKLDCGDASIDQLIRKHAPAAQPDSQGRETVDGVAEAELLSPGDSRSFVSDSAAPGSSVAAHDKRIGDYLLTKPLGQGGMGTVFKARHESTGAVAAVKILQPKRLVDRIAIERFEREMVALGSLDHPNIVRALDAGEDRGTHYLVMEYVDGVDLGRVCQSAKQLQIDQAAEIIHQAALGIQYVHDQGRIHRDIKPSNLMLSNAGQVKVLDLGLARVDELPMEDPAVASDNIMGDVSQDLTRTHQVMGTLAYMAPEQAVDSRSVDHRADIYALGGTLYKLLTGSAPFGNSTSITAYSQVLAHLQKPVVPVRDIRPEVPEELSDLVDQMLAKDPDDRPQSAGEVARRVLPFRHAADLQPLVEIGQGVAASATDTLVDASTQRQREEFQPVPPANDTTQDSSGAYVLAALAAVAMVMLIGGLVLWNSLVPQNGTVIVSADSEDIQSALSQSGAYLVSDDDGRIALTARPMQIPIGKYEVVTGNDPGLSFSPSQFEVSRDQQIILRVTRVPLPDTGAGLDAVASLDTEAGLGQGAGPLSGAPPPTEPTPPPSPESVSLISLVDPERDIRSDDWVLSNAALECRSDRIAYMKFPYRPPADYRVDMLVERIESDDCLVLGITGGENCYLICFDAHPDAGWVTGLTRISGQSLPSRRAYTHRGQLLKQGEPTLISAEVHHQGQRMSVQVNVHGKTILQWRGSKQSLTPVSPTGNYPHDDPSTLFLSNWNSKFLVSDLRVTSLEGNGQAIEFANPDVDPVRAAAELAIWKGGKIKVLDESEQALTEARIPKPVGGFELVRKFHGHRGRVKAVAISKDGKYAASGSGWPSGDRTVRVWEIETGNQKHSFNAGFNVMYVAFSPDGKTVAAAGISNRFRTWDLDSGKPVLDVTMNDVTRIEELRYSPDGSEIVLSKSREPELMLLDASTGEEVRRLQLQDYTLGYKFVPGQNTLAVGYGDGSIGLIDFNTGEERKRLQRPPLPIEVTSVHDVPAYCLDVSPDGTLVAAGYRGQYSAHIWDIETGQPLVDIVTAERGPEQITFTRDGSQIVLSGSTGVVSLIDVATGQIVGSTERVNSHGWAMAMMPDGKSVLIGGGPETSNSFSGFNGFFPTPSGDFDLRLWKLGRANAAVLAEASQPIRPTRTIGQLSGLPDGDFKMVEIDLSGSSLLRDQDLANLSKLDHLERLDLSGSGITESGLAQLGKLPNLQSLSIARNPIQSLTADLDSKFPKLRELDLHSTDLAEIDRDALAGLQSLESIDLSMTSIDDEAVDALAGAKTLREVNLAATEVTDAAVKTLSEIDSLEQLNLAGTQIGEAESLVQGKWPSLQSLNVINTDVPETRLEAFSRQHENAKVTSPFSTIDLISVIDPNRDATEGEWNKVDGVLEARGKQCVLPLELPEAFEIRARIRRVAGRNSPIFQLPLSDGTDVMVGFDHWPQEGPFVIIHGIDGQMEKSSPVKEKVTALPYLVTATGDVGVKVQRVGEQIEITASVNDSPVATWTGDPQRLTPGFYGVNKHQPSVWSNNHVDFLSLELTPLEGEVRLDQVGPDGASLDREVAEWTLQHGGQVRIVVPNDPSITGERYITNLDSLPTAQFKVTEIDNLFGVQLPADWLVKVGRLGMLRFLGLRGTKFDNADLIHLKASRSIRYVRFWNSTLDDEGVRALSQMRSLKNAGLQHTGITSKAIQYLRNHPSIDRLTTDVQSDVVADVALTIPKMRHIGVFSETSPETLKKIAQLEWLDSLHLRKSTGLSAAALQPIVDRNVLTSLWLQHGDVDASVVESVSKLTKLTYLDIADNTLGRDGAVSLSKLQSLGTLRIDETGIGDASVAAISSLPNLRELYLTGNPDITDRCIPDLCRMNNLRSLYVYRTSISESGLRTLRSALRACEIYPATNDSTASDVTAFHQVEGNEELWWQLRGRSPRNLVLHGSLFSDQTIPILVRQHQLRSITLDQTHITVDGLAELVALPNLQRIVVVPVSIDPTHESGDANRDRSDVPIQWTDADRIAKDFPHAEVEFLKEISEELGSIAK